MTRYFLSQISLEGFRGINNDGDPLVLNFRPDAINSVHAPNGVGKSSIFEALHYAIFDSVPRLETMQGAEHGDSYIINKFHPNQQATIALVFASDDSTADVEVTVSRDAHGNRVVGSPSGHPNPDSFLLSLREDFVLVDYKRFADFIDTSALERGRSFASLVGLNRYSRLRRALEGTASTRNINTDLGMATLDTEISTATQALNATEQRLLTAHNSVTGKTTDNIDDILTLKEAVTEALSGIAMLQPLLSDCTVMDFDFDAAEKLVDKQDGGSERKRLEQLASAKTSLSSIGVTQAEHDDLEALVSLANDRDRAIAKVGTASIHSLFKDALAVVEGEEWIDDHLCPVCETDLDEPLKDKLIPKLALYDDAAQLDIDLNKQAKTSIGLLKLKQLEEVVAMGVAAEDRLHATISIAARQASIATDDLVQAKKLLGDLETKRSDILAKVDEETLEVQKKMPPSLVQVTRVLSAAKQFRDEVRIYEASLKPLAQKKTKLANLTRWKKFIGDAAGIFATAETDLANARISDIQQTCQGLFGSLVRGGPNVKPSLQRAEKSENVDLILEDFFGLPDLSARALLSESYRNAVAAAIFLSAATKHSGIPRFIVLDDITSSFDAGHQFSLMEALRTQLRNGAVADGLQFIILSHDTSLEKYFDNLHSTADWHHQKLQGMPPKGRLMVSTQDADRLKAQAMQYLNAGQIDIGEPFLRQYLEYKLGQIITKLQILVPPDYANRGDRRTLSTFINAITKAVDLYHAVGRCVLDTNQMTDLGNRHAPFIMANYVSHYETGVGTPFNAHALLGVLQSVDDLADCFCYVDPNNGQKRYYRRLDRRT